MKLLKSCKLTKPPTDEENPHYTLYPQRGCFLRCAKCLNLSQAESYEKDGVWHWSPECFFCVQRLIDLLGWYEHGKVPELYISGKPKKREPVDDVGIYAALKNAAKMAYDEEAEPLSDVFEDCVGEE